MNRFSKATVTADIQSQIDQIQKLYGFDDRCGTAQIPHIIQDSALMSNETFHAEKVTIAYGAFRSLSDLAERLELDVRLQLEGAQRKSLGRGYIRYVSAPDSVQGG